MLGYDSPVFTGYGPVRRRRDRLNPDTGCEQNAFVIAIDHE